MTKEEYEKLLQSDYWKGFSYSLIKERNFTCEDCGRRFYNQRNKLQVHHLVYRDINPWSYKPEEMVVLCEECHKKRHGIWQDPIQEESTTHSHVPFGDYAKSYSYSEEIKEERPHHSTFQSEADRWGNPIGMGNGDNVKDRNPFPEEPQNKFNWKYVLCGLLILLALTFGWNKFSQLTSNENREQIETNQSEERRNEDKPSSVNASAQPQDREFKIKKTDNSDAKTTDKTIVEEHSVSSEQMSNPKTPSESYSGEDLNEVSETQKTKKETQRELTTLEILERRNHEEVVKQARRAGVSTEGSTTDILERINHAEVVKQAKRAGVSTEGSTTDILERINHAEVVKQAKRTGVSTEGSTTDILERINHAEVVKQAKRVGVSTEGSTTDILERINHKELERMNW
jgi:hypothetical protein